MRKARIGDIIYPKLFTLVLEDIFKNLHWEDNRLVISDERLSNRGFVHDITIFARSENVLLQETRKVDLEMRISKTKFVTCKKSKFIRLPRSRSNLRRIKSIC